MSLPCVRDLQSHLPLSITLYCIMRLNNDILNEYLENHFNVKTNHNSVLHESVVFAAWLFLIYVDVGLLCDVAVFSIHS